MRHSLTLNRWNFTIPELDYKTCVTVPHTWNVDEQVMKHRDIAEYEMTTAIDESLRGKKAYISFRAVYHTAKVYINDTFVGEHRHSGYTPFKFEVTDYVIFGGHAACRFGIWPV